MSVLVKGSLTFPHVAHTTFKCLSCIPVCTDAAVPEILLDRFGLSLLSSYWRFLVIHNLRSLPFIWKSFLPSRLVLLQLLHRFNKYCYYPSLCKIMSSIKLWLKQSSIQNANLTNSPIRCFGFRLEKILKIFTFAEPLNHFLLSLK